MIYIIITLWVAAFGLYSYVQIPLAKFFVFCFSILILGSITVYYLYNLSLETLKNDKKHQELIKNKSKQSKNRSKASNKYPKVEVNDENYKNLVSILKYLMQNKVLSHEQILDFTDKINAKLGDHTKYYKQSSFQNNLHEIYCKLKSKQLKTEDYIELTQILKSYNN